MEYEKQGSGPPPAYQPPPGQYPPPQGPPPPGGYPTQPPPPPGMYPAQPGYPQQPVGYSQPGAPPSTVVVTQPTMVVTQQRFRESPVSMTCPHCSAQITTSTEYSVGTMAWMVAGGVCLAGLAFPVLWLGCCFIPLCIPSLKDVIHTCPSCSQEVGRFDRTRS